jgi:hypothetical protein
VNPLVVGSTYVAGRREGANLEWAVDHGPESAPLVSHLLEANGRRCLQASARQRQKLARRTARSTRRLRLLTHRIDASRREVRRLIASAAELDTEIRPAEADALRKPGEHGMRSTIVVARRNRERLAEQRVREKAVARVSKRLAKEERRAERRAAVIRTAIRRTTVRVSRIREYYARRAEIAARGLTHRSTRAAFATGLLTQGIEMAEPDWLASIHDVLLTEPYRPTTRTADGV